MLMKITILVCDRHNICWRLGWLIALVIGNALGTVPKSRVWFWNDNKMMENNGSETVLVQENLFMLFNYIVSLNKLSHRLLNQTVSLFKWLQGPSWSWSYGSWIYIYLCNQCLSPLKRVWTPFTARCTRYNIMW
jgi:hypothetical protein